MIIYVYTKKAEERAKQLGLDERKEGTEAYCGHTPVYKLGTISKEWLKAGYIKEAEVTP